MKTDATRDEEIARLERRIAALGAMQKRVLDAVLVLGLSSAAWDPEEVAITLRELADTLDGAPASESFVAEITDDALRLVTTCARTGRFG